MQTRNIKGFTLIELLVVIAIIALLLAILMPSLKAAKKHAETVVCLNNLKQIGMAANLYANDNKGWIPRGISGGHKYVWFLGFLPYVGHDENITDYKQVDIYKCKSFPRSGTGIDGISNSKQTICYVINGWQSNDSGVEMTDLSKITSFRRRASIIYLADNESGSWRPVVEDASSVSSTDMSRFDFFKPSHSPTSTNETSKNDGRRVAKDRHNKGCNVLFLDWHAENMKTEDITIKNFRDK